MQDRYEIHINQGFRGWWPPEFQTHLMSLESDGTTALGSTSGNEGGPSIGGFEALANKAATQWGLDVSGLFPGTPLVDVEALMAGSEGPLEMLMLDTEASMRHVQDMAPPVPSSEVMRQFIEDLQALAIPVIPV